MLPAMSFFKRIWQSLSSGDPEVAGGDPEAEAILREEYGPGDPDVPLEQPTGGGPIAASGLTGPGEAGESGLAGLEVTEAEKDAIDPPPDP
jgi:hypothetical protein